MNHEIRLAHTVGVLLIFLIGLYFGIFFGEAKVFYSCQKDGRTVISGAFWKGYINIECKKPETVE